MEFFKKCWMWVLPLAGGMVASLVLFSIGMKSMAQTVSLAGVLLALVANPVYITIVHSRRRWPGVPWYKRFRRYATFSK